MVPDHFTTVCTGNGINIMHVYIKEAALDGIPLEPGDEIALFDGEKCVGAGILNEPLSPDHLLEIDASADDGSGNGFIEGHTIRFVVFDISAGKEVNSVTAEYDAANPSTGIITVQYSGISLKGIRISVMNPLGQQITDREMKNHEEVIDLKGFTRGIYYFRVTGDNWSKIEKILLK